MGLTVFMHNRIFNQLSDLVHNSRETDLFLVGIQNNTFKFKHSRSDSFDGGFVLRGITLLDFLAMKWMETKHDQDEGNCKQVLHGELMKLRNLFVKPGQGNSKARLIICMIWVGSSTISSTTL